VYPIVSVERGWLEEKQIIDGSLLVDGTVKRIQTLFISTELCKLAQCGSGTKSKSLICSIDSHCAVPHIWRLSVCVFVSLCIYLPICLSARSIYPSVRLSLSPTWRHASLCSCSTMRNVSRIYKLTMINEAAVYKYSLFPDKGNRRRGMIHTVRANIR
jgi:hypothetical protein